MDIESAKSLIRSTFENNFDKEQFLSLVKNMLNYVEDTPSTNYQGNIIPDAYKPYIQKLERPYKYLDPEGKKIDILIVHLKKETSLERARTMQRNFIAWYLNGSRGGDFKDAALAAFVSPDQEDWRFSLVKMEYRLDMSVDKVKAKQEFTPARRYSYLVGKNENSHTAQSRLFPHLRDDDHNPTLEDLEDAFSIEKVTKEFFEQYRDLFLNVKEALDEVVSKDSKIKKDFEQKNVDTVDFSKKLLGQIVFLYFLQKKGWFGVERDADWGTGPKNFLRQLFEKKLCNYENFFNEILEHLFYEALALERTEDYYGKLNCKIPFLNGGLFDPINIYDWVHTDILLPNELFSNSKITSKEDTGTGILDVFDRYNFTVREDEPLEKEVAVDPEMLGKVFENLLEVRNRKSKGTFYTPREVVHYMCQESLIHYLESELNSDPERIATIKTDQKKLGGGTESEKTILNEAGQYEIVKREEFETLIRFGETVVEHDSRVTKHGKETEKYSYKLPKIIRRNAQRVDDALAGIRICDPAVGSGAFLVGMMSEIVRTRNALTNYLKDATDRSPYKFKRHAIHDCLYGVDSDPGAVEICKLRLWLSLVVDEEDIKLIQPLPNLDYKVIAGNSLLGFPYKPMGLEEIERLKFKYFEATRLKDKQALKNKIDEEIYIRLKKSKNSLGFEIDFDFEVFFSEIFREKKGFDLVIGNPPYVQIQKYSGEQIQKDLGNQNYKTFSKTGDIYCLFYEKGAKLLKAGGALTFITSNKWMRANYGKKLRQFFLNDVAICRLIDFGESPIFKEATTYTNIILFSKSKKNIPHHSWDLSTSYSPNSPLNYMLAKAGDWIGLYSEDAFLILPEKLSKFKKRVEEIGRPIKDWVVSINYGIKTGYNEAFIIDGKKKNELISKDPKNANIIKPILRGRDIKKYKANFADLWLIDTHNGFKNTPPVDIEDYPILKAHLDESGEKIYKRQDKGITPYNLRNCAYHEDFKNEKIIWLEMSPSPNFCYDNSNTFVLNTAYILSGSSLKYLLAVLNSKVLSVYFPMISTDIRGKTRRYTKQYVENLPIPKIDDKDKEMKFEFLVDYIKFAKEKDLKLQSAYLEQLIDGLVYELYFSKEIKIANKEIFENLGGLKPIEGNMNEEDKLAIIQGEFNRLYDPSHPVRNNLETLDSIEIIKIIQDAAE